MFSPPTPPRCPGGMFLTGVLTLCSGCGSETWEEHPLHPLEHFERDLGISEAAAERIEQGPLAALSAQLGGLDVYLPDWVSPSAQAFLPPASARRHFADQTLLVHSLGSALHPLEFDPQGTDLLASIPDLIALLMPPRETLRREGELLRFRLAPDGQNASGVADIFLAGFNESNQRCQVRLRCALAFARGNQRWQITALGLESALQASTEFPAFRDVTRRTGFSDGMGTFNKRLLQEGLDDHRTLALGGLTVLDWNRDGFLDVLATRKGQLTTLLQNDGESGFLPVPHPIEAPLLSPAFVLWVDLDGDGLEELVGSEPLDYEGEQAFLSLWTRTGADPRTWRRIERAFSLPNPRGLRRLAIQTVVPFDAEGDGDLDLFVAVYGSGSSRGPHYNTVDAQDGADNHLLINNEGLIFTEESDSRGILGQGYTYVATAFDFDQDGDSDLFEGNDFGPNHLWLNDGSGNFAVSKEPGLSGFSAYTMGSSLADYDNEGVWSLYLSNMSSEQGQRMLELPTSISEEMRQRVGIIAQGNGLHRQGDAGWLDHATAAGCAEAQWSWGSAFFDPDGDGDLDLAVTNGFASHSNPNHPDWQTYYWRQVLDDALRLEEGQLSRNVNLDTKFQGSFNGFERDCLFWNMDGSDPHGERCFVEAGWLLGLDGEHDGRALAPLDFDGDGDTDLALWTLQGLRLYENLSPPQTTLIIEPQVKGSSAGAIGAVVSIESGEHIRRAPFLLVSGFQTQNEASLRFATSNMGKILRARVQWPDGTEEVWDDLPSQGRVRLEKGQSEHTSIPVPRWPRLLDPGQPQPALDAAGRGIDGPHLVGRPGQPTLVLFTRDSIPSALLRQLLTEHPGVALTQVSLNGEPAPEGEAPWPILAMTEELALRFFDQRKPDSLTAFAFDANGDWRRLLTEGTLKQDLAPLLALLAEEAPFPELSVEAGRRALNESRFRAAQVYFQNALDQDPSRTDAWDGMARTHLSFSRLAKAEECYAAAVAADPDYALGHLNLGVARVKGNKISEALMAFEQALEIDPTNIRAHLFLATASASLGDLPRAQLALEAAAEHDPSAEPYLLMTQIALAAKDQSAAQAALEKVKLREPQHPDLQALEQRIRALAPK
ncbi:MAG TPA: tetratricopeptide repeat protein [Planctomycetes bacterium]|nr:tetratricopeptide repeat protein [Planctomycetota bacterium]